MSPTSRAVPQCAGLTPCGSRFTSRTVSSSGRPGESIRAAARPVRSSSTRAAGPSGFWGTVHVELGSGASQPAHRRLRRCFGAQPTLRESRGVPRKPAGTEEKPRAGSDGCRCGPVRPDGAFSDFERRDRDAGAWDSDESRRERHGSCPAKSIECEPARGPSLPAWCSARRRGGPLLRSASGRRSPAPPAFGPRG